MLFTETMDDEAKVDDPEETSVIKMGKLKPCNPLSVNMEIARRKRNHRRSISEQIDNRYTEKFGTTLAQLIGTGSSYILSGVQSTVDESSERVIESPRSITPGSSSSARADRNQREFIALLTRNAELEVYTDDQHRKITLLESKIEDLIEEIEAKEEDRVNARNRSALAEKRLRKMSALETENYRMSVEIDGLQQEIQDQAERLRQAELREPLGPMQSESTKFLMHFDSDVALHDKDEHIEALNQKINELRRELNKKDKEMNQLEEHLQNKDMALLELERTINEACRRKTNAEDELNAASREMTELRRKTTTFEDTMKLKSNEVETVKRELEAEKLASRSVRVEWETVMQKLQELKIQKHVKDKTFMHLYDELPSAVNAQFIEDDSEVYWSEGCQVDDNTEMEDYCHLECDEHSSRRQRRKSKPLRAPPPIPTLRLNKKSQYISSGLIDDETKRLNEADYEYFLMSSIAVRMNLEALFKNDEIMAVDVEKLWKISRKAQVPMNKYYFYIEDALRQEFELPEIDCRHTSSDPIPVAQGCCILM